MRVLKSGKRVYTKWADPQGDRASRPCDTVLSRTVKEVKRSGLHQKNPLIRVCAKNIFTLFLADFTHLQKSDRVHRLKTPVGHRLTTFGTAYPAPGSLRWEKSASPGTFWTPFLGSVCMGNLAKRISNRCAPVLTSFLFFIIYIYI